MASLLRFIVHALCKPTSRSPTVGRAKLTASQTRSAPVVRRSAEERLFEESMVWLRERWDLARSEEVLGIATRFPKWYFEDSTSRQHERVRSLGLHLPPHASKGQFSDVIGLFEESNEEEDLAKLKFFGIKLTGGNCNATRVRHELEAIHATPELVVRWEQRPASKLQKEFFRFVGNKVPAALTAVRAEALIEQAMRILPAERRDSWAAFIDVFDEFNDPVFRADEDIRKPSVSELRASFDTLLLKCDHGSFPDASDVATYLLERRPALGRS